jgi:hypothetical protein
MLQNPVTLQEMEDGIVDKGVYSKYCNEVMLFADWIHGHQASWFTEFGQMKYDGLLVLQEGENRKQRRKRIKDKWMTMLRNAKTNPIINVDSITPAIVMEGYISRIANQHTLKPLSPAGYGGKRTGLFHLIRCHNGKGPSKDFLDKMTTLWKGFSRTTNKKKMRARRQPVNAAPRDGDADADGEDEDSVSSGSNVDDEENDDDRNESKEGKEPMSPELYRNVCKWLLEWGNLDGIFAALYIVLTWNLVCRGNNTSKVQLSHLKWTVFDALQVNFKHTEVDQRGDTKRKKRHLFSNVFEHCIDLPFLLGLYFTCCFTFVQTRGRQLFPGSSKSQAKRVSSILQKVLKAHEPEVLAMGYDTVNDICVHSIWKGAASYLASLPGGSPPAAICLRGGWTMGQVKDIYFHQMQAGDEFTGRCIFLMNMMSANFASSPAFFNATTDKDWLNTTVSEVFPMFESTEGMGRILRMCLASLVHHRDEVLAFNTNHVARTSISLFRDPRKMQTGIDHVEIIHAWDSNIHLTGIPPHVKELADLHKLKEEQARLSTTIYEKVMGGLTEYFEARRIAGGELTEARVKAMMAEACQTNVESLVERFEEKLQSLASTFEQSVGNVGQSTRPRRIAGAAPTAPPTLDTYVIRTNPRGELSWLPNDFQFPKGGMYDCWVQWNVGTSEQSIPALRNLPAREFSFIDDIAKTASEKQCLRGPRKYQEKRQPAGKTYSDMKYICSYIELKAGEAGADPSDRSLSNVRRMFDAASKELVTPGDRNQRIDQFKWRTMVSRIRKKVKAQREAG